MEKESSSSSSSSSSASVCSPIEIDWSQIASPLPSILFEKYTHQSILPPLSSLNLSSIQWQNFRSIALNLASKGFIDPVSIVYTSFKRSYPSCSTLRSFVRWLTLNEKVDRSDLSKFIREYSTHPTPIQSVGELVRQVENFEDIEPIPSLFDKFDQVWIVCSMSIRLPNHGSQLIADTIFFDETMTRHSTRGKKATGSSRLLCLFAVTPAGKFSNQLIVTKPTRNFKSNFLSTPFTRIISSNNGDFQPEYLQQWLEDFVALNGTNQTSALLMDPRTTLFTEEFVNLCEKSNLNLLSINLNVYLTHFLSPLFTLMDKQWTELNRLDQMLMKSSLDLQRLVHSIWFILRNLKTNEEISRLFQSTPVWTKSDQIYLEFLRTPPSRAATLTKKKKKKTSLVKTASKTKLVQTSLMADPPQESTAEEIFNFIAQRQLSTTRASRFLGGIKLDYLKSYFSSKVNQPTLTGEELLRLNTFMQSSSTVDWLRKLRSTYFWPCAKQIFLREVYRMGKFSTKNKKNETCVHGSLGSSKHCDLQAPSSFWRSFEDIHQIQLENEPIVNPDQWHENFQKFLSDYHLDDPMTQLWTLDTFEFPLVKKMTVLQLPEWNEIRPMNLTPKVTVLYAFSSTGQSIEPIFIFPKTFKDPNEEENVDDFYNDLGHLTAATFSSWIEKHFVDRNEKSPIALVFCSRLPILSSSVIEKLHQNEIYPFGYPSTRTLPFRYLFERRVRNNRSTNLMSELWKKKLLEEQRTHVLKGSACSIKTIKTNFQQIWSQLLREKQDEDDEHNSEPKTWSELCHQAFQQAKIFVENSTKRKTKKKTVQVDPLVEQLNQLIDVIRQMKDKTSSASSSQILRLNNQIDENSDDLMDLSSNLTETTENVENVHPPSVTTGDKRSMDDQDESHLSKRLRSSCPTTTTTTIQSTINWIPPSKQLVTRLHKQSSSIFQFILSLIQTIIVTTDQILTDEHSRWLHATVNHYEDEYNFDKINLTIETALKVVKIDLVR